MRHGFTLLVIVACSTALLLFCYAPALFHDRQFGFRDAGHYYYPLYKRVQAEWDQGRWPLWEPEENAGMPLLGNPTAAVLYPGKLVFAVLSYAWAARIYIVAHSVLAFLTMLVLLRSWGTSWVGSATGALAYAFGAPILFQYCNIIYLVGAAWLPLGIHAVDRWARLGRRWGLLELTIVLSMQVLGGDPETAYVLGVAGIGYALGLACARTTTGNKGTSGAEPARFRAWFLLPLLAIALVLWCVVTLALAQWLPTLRGRGAAPPPLRWMPWVPAGVAMAWGLIAIGLLVHWRGRAWRFPLGAASLGLVGSAAVAVACSAAQLFPTIEFTQQTARAGRGLYDLYHFSLEPFRVVELAWPNILGVPFEGNDYWGDVIRTPGGRPKGWVPSLYMGGLTLGLAASALTLWRGPPWRVWLTAIAWLGLLGSLGQYASPIWAARAAAHASGSPALQSSLRNLGPLDPADATVIRQDGYLHDGDGSLYWWLAIILPGFRQFRFPAKLFTFTALAVAALAGLGWDRLAAARARGITAIFVVLLTSTLAALAIVTLEREPILASFRARPIPSMLGPFDPAAGYQAMLRSLGHAAIVFGFGLVLTWVARRRPPFAGCAALFVMTADLAAANARYVLTVPQSLFETKPEIAKIIAEAERPRHASGPFRIHRMPIWYPLGWGETPSKSRISEVVSWERDTMQPKHGINLGVEYTYTVGVAQLDDYDWYFARFASVIGDKQTARSLGIEPGQEVIYYPRRAFDLWNTRYFIVPFDANGWRDPTRGYASLLFQSEQIYPDPGRFGGPGGKQKAREWIDNRDFKIIRNLAEYPRAWIVHRARATVPVGGLSRAAPSAAMQEILYAGDPMWYDAEQSVYDPRTLAWVDKDAFTAIGGLLSGQPTRSSEVVKVAYPDPQHAVLDVRLDSPGLVILADAHYPGWELAIDGKPARVYRVNGSMRGAVVTAGPHRIVYTYAPMSFRVGLGVSIAGLAAFLILGLACALRPVDPVLAAASSCNSGERQLSNRRGPRAG
jgi:hypothetical protein